MLTSRSRLLAVLFSALILTGCGDDNPAAPSDPVAEMYGNFYGTFNFTFLNGSISQDAMYLKLGKDKECVLQLSGASYQTSVTSWDSDSVHMTSNFFGYPATLHGRRNGYTLSGTASVAGMGNGTWSVTK